MTPGYPGDAPPSQDEPKLTPRNDESHQQEKSGGGKVEDLQDMKRVSAR